MHLKHMSLIPLPWLAVLVLVMTTPGCPDDDHASDDGAGDADAGTAGEETDAGTSDVPAESPLSALSDADRMDVCQTLEDDYNAAISDDTRAQMRCLERVIPMTVKAPGSIDVPRCEDLLEQCLAGDEIAERGPDDPELQWNLPECDDGRLASALRACDATVAEFVACTRESVATVDRRLRGQNCQGLQDRFDMPGSSSTVVSDACKPLAEKCRVYP
jgi:hypothetical protein